MRHRVRKKRLDRHTSHRIAMFRNMVTSLIEVGRITTTVIKAKQLRPIAERMVTLAKKGTLHARRQAASYVRTPQAVKKLFSELGPRYASRPGGYTRVLRLGFRHGDSADMALIEYVGFQPALKVKGKPEKGSAKKPKKAAKEKEMAETKAQTEKTKKAAKKKD